ncbi:MAG: hypothetical protein JO076_14260 [Verrucomicrobia bacterium]|nr:hypothetical protein [Verrucomicrobiota bacterium]
MAVRPHEREAAAEFFQLFKTAWEFCRAGVHYDVVLCTGDDLENFDAGLVIVFDGNHTRFDKEENFLPRSLPAGQIVSDEGRKIPIYGDRVIFPDSKCDLARDLEEQASICVLIRRGSQRILRVGYNLFGEVRFLLTAGQPAANASIPALDEHIAELRNWITLSGFTISEIPPIPAGFDSIACLTHDLDHPIFRTHGLDHTMIGFLYRATAGTIFNVIKGKRAWTHLGSNFAAALKAPLIHLGLGKDLWSGFDRYLELEGEAGSTFFVIPEPGYPGKTMEGAAPALRASRYDPKQISSQLATLISAKREIGVHGIDAWLSEEDGKRERGKVAEYLREDETGVRMHWLFWDRFSPERLEAAGFSYDSTFGYCETVGYRAGTSQAYRPFGVERLLELPLIVMDTALFYPGYLGLSEKEAAKVVSKLFDDIAQFGGALTINWHDRSIAPERLWDAFYVWLLANLRERKAWMPNAGQAVAWFRKRRETHFGAPIADIDEKHTEKIISELPGLKIRIHQPRSSSLETAVAARQSARYVESRFDTSIFSKV